ncbi:MAG: hypothetical protein AB1696_22400 [Planctomycetota bacterium]
MLDTVDQRLTKRQRNAVLQAAVSVGLDPQRFEWSEELFGFTLDANTVVSRATYQGTTYFFLFGREGGRFYSRYSPGNELREEEREEDTWAGQFYHAEGWLKSLKAELDAPDLWAELPKIARLLDGVSHLPELQTQFASEEQDRIAEGLSFLINGVRNGKLFECAVVDRASSEEKLEYLIHESKSQKRWNWICLAVAVAFFLGKDVELGQAADVFLRFLSWIAGNIGPLLPGFKNLLTP